MAIETILSKRSRYKVLLNDNPNKHPGEYLYLVGDSSCGMIVAGFNTEKEAREFITYKIQKESEKAYKEYLDNRDYSHTTI